MGQRCLKVQGSLRWGEHQMHYRGFGNQENRTRAGVNTYWRAGGGTGSPLRWASCSRSEYVP